MADQFLDTWFDKDPDLLGAILYQLWDACWGIASTRQLEALYRRTVDGLPEDFRLSIQEVLDLMSRTYLEDNGALKDLAELIPILRDIGTVLEKDNPLTFKFRRAKKTVRSNEVRYKATEVIKRTYEDVNFNLETEIERLLEVSPVAASVIVTVDYRSIVGKVPYVSMEKELSCHLILITGFGVDCNGVRFWEAMDSYGTEQGANGIIRIARDQNMIAEYLVMSVE